MTEKKTGEKKAAKKNARKRKPKPEGFVETRGRKGTVTPEKRALFLLALENGLKIGEACIHAEISEDAYKRLRKKEVQFRAEIAVAQQKLTMLARSVIAKKIKAEDKQTAQWWLERKVPEEFRPSFGEGDIPVIGNVTVVVPQGNKPHPRVIQKATEEEDE